MFRFIRCLPDEQERKIWQFVIVTIKLPSVFHFSLIIYSYIDNVMTKLVTSNSTDAWKTEVDLLNWKQFLSRGLLKIRYFSFFSAYHSGQFHFLQRIWPSKLVTVKKSLQAFILNLMSRCCWEWMERWDVLSGKVDNDRQIHRASGGGPYLVHICD